MLYRRKAAYPNPVTDTINTSAITTHAELRWRTTVA